jgi:hypothetical protein
MSTKFKSFEEFGQAAKQEQVQNLKQQTDDIFEKSIKDDFDSIPEGPFKSNLPEINWIAFARPTNRKTGERNTETLNAVIFSKTESGKTINHTWTVNRGGTIRPIQEIPVNLAQKYSQEEIALEIASLLERIGPSFIHLTDLDIIPAQDKGPEREEGDLIIDYIDGPQGGEKPVDPERVHFLQSLRGANFEFANKNTGFKGYQGLLFDDFVYLDNLYKGNAAFIVDLPESVDAEAVEKELTLRKSQAGEEGEVSKKELREEILMRYWKPIDDKAKTRKELVALGKKLSAKLSNLEFKSFLFLINV